MKGFRTAQHIVLTLYFLGVGYCCLWVPWHTSFNHPRYGPRELRLGYGWLWAGPANASQGSYGAPDYKVIFLRIVCVSALTICALLAIQIIRTFKTEY